MLLLSALLVKLFSVTVFVQSSPFVDVDFVLWLSSGALLLGSCRFQKCLVLLKRDLIQVGEGLERICF